MTNKKLLFALMVALIPFTSVCVNAENPGDVVLELGYDDPNIGDDGNPRGSILIPHVGIEGNTLFFYTPCDGCTLRILSSSGCVEYSTVIASGTTSLVLPSYLSGTYEIQIIQGNIYFWGYIELQ